MVETPAVRFVGIDRPRRIGFSPRGATLVVVNQDPDSDIYIAPTEEELLNAFGSITTGGNLNAGRIGTKIAANGGQLNYVEYPGQLWAIASGFATPSGGGVPVAGAASAQVRVIPG
jgi:hypothetical protein